MPYEIRLPIQGERSSWPDLTRQRGAHALFLAILDAADPALAQQVHEQPDKPFTQGLLMVKEAEQWEWRVTLLDDTLYEPFMTGLAHLTEPHLLHEPLIWESDQQESIHQSYEELAGTPAMKRYQLTFLTPTTFKQRYFHHPIPDPYLCYQSWWRRWQQFAPAELGINIALLDIIQAHLVISRFQIRSRLVQDGPRRFVGAIGRMTFIPIQENKVDADWWRQAAALAAFARFCGTGHKTTQGLGQTRPRLIAA